jgi:hypothetical protein
VKTATGMTIKLVWSDQNSNEDGFVIERKTTDGIWEERGRVGANVLTYTEKLELWDTEHFYRVRAFTKFGNSVESNSVSYITPKNPNTGINDQGNISFSVYPNPNHGKFTLVTSDRSSMKIVDIKGRLILEKRNCFGSETMDISNYPEGIYFLEARNDANTKVIKLIKR